MRGRGLVIALGLLVLSCKTVYVPVKETEYVAVHDTTVLHRTDTLVRVPEFHLSDYAGLSDTLVLQASNSEARAWVDSNVMVLKGTLVQDGRIPVQVVEKERVVYRDSIITRDVPVPVEVVKTVHPRYEPWLWAYALLTLLAFTAFAYCKFRK